VQEATQRAWARTGYLCAVAIPRGAVRALSFDYGHVLGGLDLAELAARLQAASFPAQIEPIRRAQPAAYAAHDRAIAEGRGHEAGWRALMTVLVTAGGVAEAERDRMVETLWQAQPTRNLWREVPDEARALLAALAEARVPMVITSNSEGRVAELLDEVALASYFVDILDSGLLGFGKPDRRIFELAAARLGVPLDALAHIGDSERADVVGAREAGAWTIRFDHFVPGAAAVETIADARAGTFAELRAILAIALDRPL
jgi:HAD superfamily hydrolase (TIGR01549 family)